VPELAKSDPGPVRALTGLDGKLDEREPLPPIDPDDADGKVIIGPATPDHALRNVDLMQAPFDISQLRDPVKRRHDLLDFAANLGIVRDLIHLLLLRRSPSGNEPKT
jgi:hypothetical protein